MIIAAGIFAVYALLVIASCRFFGVMHRRDHQLDFIVRQHAGPASAYQKTGS